MKLYVRSDVRVKQTTGSESPEIRGYLEHDYEGHTITFLGEYQDYKGRRAYKYRIEHPDYDTATVFVVSTNWQYDMSDTFDDIAVYPESEITVPRMPKRAPKHSWDTDKTITVTNDFGDESQYDIIKSKQRAIEFLYGALYNADFPMMCVNQYYGDVAEYESAMRNFDNRDSGFDEDTHTDFIANGKLYSIDDEMTLRQAIDIYYAIPYVESLHQSNAATVVLYKSYIYQDEEGYWYSDLGKADDPSIFDDYMEV